MLQEFNQSHLLFCLNKFSMLNWLPFRINARKHMGAILPNLGLLIWRKGLLKFSNTGGVMRCVRTKVPLIVVLYKFSDLSVT